jgi:zinc-ribbon domain
MSLITCPDCQHEISDAAQACIYCGRPLAVPVQPQAVETRHGFFPVAPHKFIVLSVCTLNVYTLYWCYQNWWRIRERTGEQLNPFWRAFFAPVWVFSLFTRIAGQASERSVTVSWSPTLMATGYLIMSGFGMLPDPWWLVNLACFLPFVPVVQTIQQLNEAESATENRNAVYSGANVATILVGGIIVLLAVAGTFMSEEEEEEEFEPLPESTGWTSSRPATPAESGWHVGYSTF